MLGTVSAVAASALPPAPAPWTADPGKRLICWEVCRAWTSARDARRYCELHTSAPPKGGFSYKAEWAYDIRTERYMTVIYKFIDAT